MGGRTNNDMCFAIVSTTADSNCDKLPEVAVNMFNRRHRRKAFYLANTSFVPPERQARCILIETSCDAMAREESDELNSWTNYQLSPDEQIEFDPWVIL